MGIYTRNTILRLFGFASSTAHGEGWESPVARGVVDAKEIENLENLRWKTRLIPLIWVLGSQCPPWAGPDPAERRAMVGSQGGDNSPWLAVKLRTTCAPTD